jgi:hypothetical protein
VFDFQIAAELDRSETARLLVEQGSHAGVRDINGLSALVLMISKMPSVVRNTWNLTILIECLLSKTGQMFFIATFFPVVKV